MKKFVVYVLRLRNNRWYVGQTPADRLKRRIYEHRFLRGAKWSPRHGVLGLEKTICCTSEESDQIENAETLRLMCRYGLNAVRGGSLVVSWDLHKIPPWMPAPFKNNLHLIPDCPPPLLS